MLADLIQSNQHLTQLELKSQKLPQAGRSLMAEALTHNCSLRLLDMSCSELDGEFVEALTDALTVNSTLQELNLATTSSCRIMVKMVWWPSPTR